MNPWPKTRDQLEDAGYHYSHDGTCKGCGKSLTWVKTPSGKLMPLSAVDADHFQSHFVDCPNAKDFKKPVGKKLTKTQGQES